MQHESNTVSRRTALKVTGSSVAVAAMSGLSSAKPGEGVEVNVGFTNDSGRKAALNAASDVVREFDFDALTLQVPEQAVSGLKNNPNVRYIEENGTYQALGFSCNNCGLGSVDAPGCSYGSGADVAVIDTGIQSTHSDLDHVLGAGAAFSSCSGSSCGCYQSWDDDNGHGTHCAGIVHSVAPYATIHGVKVLSGSGSGYYSDIAAGVEWTANRGYDVASLSLGGGSGSATMRDALQYAQNRGVLIVAAAGNNYGGSVSYPAAYPEAMAVSAVDCNDNFAYYSNQGSEVEITAPGSGIDSTYPCGTCSSLSGTSMATPHVAGGAAAVMAQGYSNGGARHRLKSTADNIGLSSNQQGAGRLNVGDATC